MYKNASESFAGEQVFLCFGLNVRSLAQSFLNSSFERRRFQNRDSTNGSAISLMANCITGKLSQIIPQIPTPPSSEIDVELYRHRLSLPIFQSRTAILDAIDQHQVIVVAGMPGVGKTTQIPQYILEQQSRSQSTCCIISSQPNRIDALGVADRIAVERGEPLGQTVGFQIRLESK